MEKQKIELTREKFEAALEKELRTIKDSIDSKRLCLDGELKRNPLLNLYDEGKLKKEFIIQEMPRIQDKTSKLSSAKRRVLSGIISKAINRAAKEIQEQEKNGDTETKHQP